VVIKGSQKSSVPKEFIAVVCLFFIDVFYLRLDVFLAISILSRSDVGRNFEVVV